MSRARRGGLGAVDRRSGAARVTRVTGSLDEGHPGRLLQVRLGAFGSDVGELTGFRETDMSVLIIFLDRGGERSFPGHDFLAAAKARVGSPSGRGCWLW
jgi:hypothetical protein